MKNKVIHDFASGLSANTLKSKLGIEINSFRDVKMKEFKGISSKDVKIDASTGHAFYSDGENQFMMFRYKNYCYTNWRGKKRMPTYHVYDDCKTLKEHTGFVYSNKMPVEIKSKDEQKVYQNQTLKMCGNCSSGIFKSWWGGDKPWYEAILAYIENQTNPSYRLSDGYHSMWNQISEAYKEKQNYCCEGCGIYLGKNSDKGFLHTHHVNGDIKDNRADNFRALCLLCHSLEHKERLQKGIGILEVEYFIENYRDVLDKDKITEFNRIVTNRYNKLY